MAVGIILGGSALSFAGVAATSSHGPKPKPSVSASPEPSESEAAEPADNETNGTNGQHPINHGFYVSQAAQCKAVDDAINNVHLSPPSDCATNGQAHSTYVKTVAQSDAGKGAHGNGHAKSHSKSH
jgi:hypothetical protein